MRLRSIAFAVALILTRPLFLSGQTRDLAEARRIAAIGAAALDEYAAGVEDGRVVSLTELDEARAFLEEARRKLTGLSAPVRSLTAPAIDRLAAGVEQHRPVGDLRTVLDTLRRKLESTLKAPLDPLPAAAPSLARGAQLFHLRCAECHGNEGRGDGPKAEKLDPKPANFTLRDSLRAMSPLDFFRKITVGVSGTEMREWESLIPLEDRWTLALYVSGLRYSDAERERGGQVLRERCAACQQLVSDLAETAGLSDDSL